MHTGRATGQDNAARVKTADLLFRHRERPDFAIDAAFTYTARDELCDLATEIKDQNAILMKLKIEIIGVLRGCFGHGALSTRRAWANSVGIV